MKEKICYNCQHTLNSEQQFCSQCGQKVDDNNLSLKAISQDFFENYISLDTRIGRSILPFLVKPGHLVVEFINGKRVSYVNPFRFYLFISIFFFFVLGLVVDKTVSQAQLNSNEGSSEIADIEENKSGLSSKLNEFAILIDSLEQIDSSAVELKMDSLLQAHELDQRINFSNDSSVTSPKSFVKLNSSGLGFHISANRLIELDEYRYDKNYSDQMLLDSLGADNLGKIESHLAIQTIRLYRSDAKVITKFMLGNLSISLLFLIPGLAFFFYLFYFKKRMPFVAHLIHSLNLHTFALFAFSISMLLYYYLDYMAFIWFACLLSGVYLFFSLKKVYSKRVFSTFWRFVSVGILYYFYLVFTVTLGVIISFLLF